jgi:hypothetical protein
MMPMWLFILIVFVAAFLGAFFASCFEFERREEKKDGKERISRKAED